MAPRFWSPLYLTGTVGPLTAIGTDLVVNPRALLNPNRGPMLIDQFRFSFVKGEGTEHDADNLAFLSTIACEIRLGAVPFMPKPVTLGSFVPRYVGNDGAAVGSPYSNVFNPPTSQDSIFVWHLHKPLFVPQNVQLLVRLIRQRLYQQGTMVEPDIAFTSVRVSAIGRSLPEDEPNPQQMWVPWVTETKASVDSDQFVSGDADIVNSNEEPLHVKALCSVNYRRVTESANNGPTPGDLRVQMTASNGTAFIRDPTPYGLVFPIDRGTLSIDAVLQPGQFMRCALEIPASPAAAPAADKVVQFTSVGMTGYRRIATPRNNP